MEKKQQSIAFFALLRPNLGNQGAHFWLLLYRIYVYLAHLYMNHQVNAIPSILITLVLTSEV